MTERDLLHTVIGILAIAGVVIIVASLMGVLPA